MWPYPFTHGIFKNWDELRLLEGAYIALLNKTTNSLFTKASSTNSNFSASTSRDTLGGGGHIQLTLQM